MPGEVAGEHADQHVGLDMFLEPVEDGPQVQVVGFDVPEVPFDVFEVLVGGHHSGRVEFAGRDRGAEHVEPVQGGLGVDLVLPALHGQGGIGDGDGEVLAGLVPADRLADLNPISQAPVGRQARTRAMSGASSFSVAAGRLRSNTASSGSTCRCRVSGCVLRCAFSMMTASRAQEMARGFLAEALPRGQ